MRIAQQDSNSARDVIDLVLLFFDVKVNDLVFVQIAVYELVIGLWLVVKGIRDGGDLQPIVP